MPRLGSCPAGTYTFRDGTTATRLTPDHDPVLTMPKDAAVYYDDFDGNNVRDSLTRIRCSIGWPSADSVVALTPTGATSARALGVVATAAPDALERISGYEVDRGSVRVVIDKAPGTKPSTVDYRWTKNGFRKI
jgi:hypothetical protein